jgi:hypothetical protein
MRYCLIASIAWLLTGCAMPVMSEAPDSVRITCVLANCNGLAERYESEGRRVSVTCLMARCASVGPTR